MWYCTVCGKRHVRDEASPACERCAAQVEEAGAKGEKIPALYCHSCGNKNKSESAECERCNYGGTKTGDIVVEQGKAKLLLDKIDTLINKIDKFERKLPEEKASVPEKGPEGIRHGKAIIETEPAKALLQTTPTKKEIKENLARKPCPDCNPDGNNPNKGKCRYCDGAGWWPCRRCGGEGVVKGSVVGVFTDKAPVCPKCHGGKWFGCGLCDSPATDLEGKIRPGNGLCRTCHGSGYVS